MPHHHPYLDRDLQEVSDRNRNARELIRAFASTTLTLVDIWTHITDALDDTPSLVNDVMRLRSQIARLRLLQANLIAAGNATLSAHADGEDDPLFYLRDELSQHARTVLPAKAGDDG
ncbi:hypothetical protein ACWENQ_43550 [Nonomuraea sp. NPDC004354]